MKICTKCLVSKFESDFFVKDKKTGRLHTQCKECYKSHRKTYYAEHYSKYGDLYRERAKLRRIEIQQGLRSKMLEYLHGKSCALCGENDIRTFEFDHLEPKLKSFGIARAIGDGTKWDKILLEIQKCRILCANCHKKHTSSQFGWYKTLQKR
ncbi:MAG: hypothetical protein JWN75_698 [Candidatus Saccharibacteria bacterium]|nr:hypothetical protein [Candidatus Saccharibacteria bacterium]